MFFQRFVRDMGAGSNMELQSPAMAGDERFVTLWARFERSVDLVYATGIWSNSR